MAMSVILNPAEGWAQIGPLQVSIRLTGHNGALQINGDLGPCLHPVSFMERSRITTYASVSNKPSQAMAKLVVEASLQNIKQSANQADPLVVAIIALVLAGANEANMPSFIESALLVSRQSGWTPEQLGQSNAADIDKMAQQLVADADDGWIRLRFNTAEESDLDLIQNELADNLLKRLQPSHDMLHTATPLEKSIPNPIADRSASLFERSEQQPKSENNTSSLMDESKSRKTKSAEVSTSSVAAAAMRIREKEGVSSSADDPMEQAIPTTPAQSDKEMEPADHRTMPVADVDMETPDVKDPLFETGDSQFSPNSSSVDEHPVSIAKASPVIPLAGENNQYSSSRHNSPDIAVAIAAPERQTTSISSSLTDIPYEHEHEHEHERNNATDKFNRFDISIAQHIPSQTQTSAKTMAYMETELDEIMDELTARLHLEADLRGVDR